MLTSITEVQFSNDEITEMLIEKMGIQVEGVVHQAITTKEGDKFVLKVQIGDPEVDDRTQYIFS